jgi:hypothetical protein
MWRVDRSDLETFLVGLHERTAKWIRSHPMSEAIPGLYEVKPRPAENTEAMTIREAAEMLGVTRQNVHHLVKVGRLVAE